MNGYGKQESVVGCQGSSQVAQVGSQLPRAQETPPGNGGVVQQFFGPAVSYNNVFSTPGTYTLNFQPSAEFSTSDQNAVKPFGFHSSSSGQTGLQGGHRLGSGYEPGSSGSAPGGLQGGHRLGGVSDYVYSNVGGGPRPSTQ